MGVGLCVFCITGLAAVSASTIHKDELTTLTALYGEIGKTSLVFACEALASGESCLINLMEALIAGHEVEGALTIAALPRDAFVSAVRREAFRFLAFIANHIAALEATLAAADGAHPILDKVHESGALEAEEVVELVGTLLTLAMFEELKGKLMTEHEEVCTARWTLDKRCLRSLQLSLAFWVDADYLDIHRFCLGKSNDYNPLSILLSIRMLKVSGVVRLNSNI